MSPDYLTLQNCGNHPCIIKKVRKNKRDSCSHYSHEPMHCTSVHELSGCNSTPATHTNSVATAHLQHTQIVLQQHDSLIQVIIHEATSENLHTKHLD